jgi:hypothetical protein
VPPITAPRQPAGPLRFLESLDVTTFRRGNLHTHSTNSDGDHPPEEVYAWYRDHGYAFVALTDHNVRTDPDEYRSLEVPGRFVLLPGEEVTLTAREPSRLPVHVNAICTEHTIGGGTMSTVPIALAWAVTRIHADGAIALVNHPNAKWALTAEDLRYAESAEMLEIWSGHPSVRTAGGRGHPSAEALWETTLRAGQRFAPAAVDDMHRLEAGVDERRAAGPGRAWVEVFATEITRRAICADLSRGRHIASSGAQLKRLHVEGDMFEIEPAADATIEFIGDAGVLIRERVAAGARASYRLRGTEWYVRARITVDGVGRAWTQAYRTSP